MAEAELLKLQEEVVRKIRSNQQLEQDLITAYMYGN